MPTEFAFRLSTYLTLGMACLCLGYAEWDFLPEATLVAGFVIALLVISFFCEGRFVLDLRAANQLGFVIGLIAVIWLGFQFVRKDSLIYTFPWPASLLPYLGPLLMILMPAKLFRPKHIGDWWAMQGLGLATTGLATAMAEDALFGALLAVYGLVVVWSLTLFYFRRSAGLLPKINPEPDAPVPIVVSPAQFVGRVLVARGVLAQSLGWFGIALLLSLPLFFLTPRSQAPRWRLTKVTIETGLGDGQIDLTRTGQMKQNRDVAFTVTATYPNGRPKEDLVLSQRWRAAHYQQYSEGSWRFRTLEGRKFLIDRNSMVLAVRGPGDSFPPSLHPNQYYLDFVPQFKTLFRIVKDPVRWKGGEIIPIASYYPDRIGLWSQSLDGHFVPGSQSTRHRQVSYDDPEQEEDLGPACEVPDEIQQAIFSGAVDTPLSTFKRTTGLPKIREYAYRLLTRLAQSNPKLKTALERGNSRGLFEVDPLDYEIVARAFSNYLGYSGEFAYSLTLSRTDMNLDPIEDFLTLTKSGQCERFATALTLMCRSLGIPAVYVIGFKGCEPGEAPGQYVIRQSDAHAWVEIFIPRARREPAPAGRESPYVWHWLSLDPTPELGEEIDTSSLGDWLGNAKQSGVGFFLDFIVGYNSERRIRIVDAVKAWLWEWGWTIPLVPIGFVGLWIIQRAIRRRAQPQLPAHEATLLTGLSWFDEFRMVLEAHELNLPPGKTWLEHLSRLREKAATQPAVIAHLEQIITAFYQARYANQLPENAKALEESVSALRQAWGDEKSAEVAR